MTTLVLVLGALGVLIVWRINARGWRFAEGLATLLEHPVIGRVGLRSFLLGTAWCGGEYQGRPVTAVLRGKRDEGLGYLVLGVRANHPFRARIDPRSVKTGLTNSLNVIRARPLGDSELDARFFFDVDDAGAVRAWLLNADMRHAVKALVAENALSLEVKDGWVRAIWQPVGLYFFPPEPFDPTTWTAVLRHLHALAESLDPRPVPTP